MTASSPATTPDGRYIVVRGRLWRASNPSLSTKRRQQLVRALMCARRLLASPASPAAERRRARYAVQQVKCWLGERGPVWWHDGAPDYQRCLVQNSPYAAWAARQRPLLLGASSSQGR